MSGAHNWWLECDWKVKNKQWKEISQHNLFKNSFNSEINIIIVIVSIIDGLILIPNA